MSEVPLLSTHFFCRNRQNAGGREIRHVRQGLEGGGGCECGALTSFWGTGKMRERAKSGAFGKVSKMVVDVCAAHHLAADGEGGAVELIRHCPLLGPTLQ